MEYIVCVSGRFALHQWRANTYLGSVKYMLAFLGDEDEAYMQSFTASLSLAIVFIPLIAASKDKIGLAGSMQGVTALAALHAFLALIPSLPLQLVTFVVFTVTRASIFTVATFYVAEVFGFQRLGTVFGLWQTASAVLNASIPPLTALVLDQLGGDWSAVLWTFVGLCIPQFATVVYLTRALQAPSQKTLV